MEELCLWLIFKRIECHTVFCLALFCSWEWSGGVAEWGGGGLNVCQTVEGLDLGGKKI